MTASNIIPPITASSS